MLKTFSLSFIFSLIALFTHTASASDLSAYPGLLNLGVRGSEYASSAYSTVPMPTRTNQLSSLAALQLADVLQTMQFLKETETRQHTTWRWGTEAVNVGSVINNGQLDTSKFNGNGSCSVDGQGNGYCLKTGWHATQHSYTNYKYYETNPLLGERPSALRLLGFSTVCFGAVAAITHYLPPQLATVMNDSIVTSMTINVEGNTALTSPGMLTKWNRGPIPIVLSFRW
jgi:hypothetical protein